MGNRKPELEGGHADGKFTYISCSWIVANKGEKSTPHLCVVIPLCCPKKGKRDLLSLPAFRDGD